MSKHSEDAVTGSQAPAGPLHGLPVTIKDAIATAGIRSTGGASELADHVPTADPLAVRRLRQAGAIVYGKTNTPRWSGDIQTCNDRTSLFADAGPAALTCGYVVPPAAATERNGA